MAINVTRWRPDTCGCELEYAWDTDVPAEERVHTLVKSIPCEIHTGLGYVPDDPQHYDAVLEENQRKNAVFAKAIETIPEMTFVVLSESTGEPEARQRIDAFDYAFDADRNLHYTLALGKAEDHALLDAAVALDFADKAVLVAKEDVDALKAAK